MTAEPNFESVPSVARFRPPERRLFKYLFCAARDSFTRAEVNQLAQLNGLSLPEVPGGLFEALRGAWEGEVLDCTAQNQWKRELLAERGIKYLVVNGREDEAHSLQRYREEADALGITLEVVTLDQLAIASGRLAGLPGDAGECHAILLSSPETFASDSAPVLRFRQEVMRQLSLVKPVIPSPASDFEARDKLRSAVAFADHEVPHPRTVVTSSVGRALEFVEAEHAAGRPAVIKPLGKGGGWGVARIPPGTSRRQILDVLGKYLWWYGAGVLFLQEFVPNAGFDKRVLVVDEVVLGVEERVVPDADTSWIYNISKGAVGRPGTLSATERAVVLAAYHATHQVVSGVDLITGTDDQPRVLETNSCPGFEGFERYVGVNVASFVLSYFALFPPWAR